MLEYTPFLLICVNIDKKFKVYFKKCAIDTSWRSNTNYNSYYSFMVTLAALPN